MAVAKAAEFYLAARHGAIRIWLVIFAVSME
jgi:hypothetical protein